MFKHATHLFSAAVSLFAAIASALLYGRMSECPWWAWLVPCFLFISAYLSFTAYRKAREQSKAR